MPHDRFFIDTPFQTHENIDLKEEARHLKVMRIRPGDSLELVNGRNQLAHARVVDTHTAEILSVEERDPPYPIILCQAIPRQNRLDIIVEKGTELGMTELWLFPGAQSEKKTASLDRLKKISIAAMKQCGRLDLPKIVVMPPLLQWNAFPYPAYFGDVSEEAPPFLSVIEKNEGICFFIGPEAGFTSDEARHLKHLRAKGVKLHAWTLRTETAALAALTLMHSFTFT